MNFLMFGQQNDVQVTVSIHCSSVVEEKKSLKWRMKQNFLNPKFSDNSYVRIESDFFSIT